MAEKADDASNRALIRARKAVQEIHAALKPDFAIELWDGSRVPAVGPADGLRIAIGGPEVITRLIRRPKLKTLVDLYTEGAIDIRGGTIFDIAERRPAVRSREVMKRLNKWTLLKSLGPFAFASANPVASKLDGGAEASKSKGSAKSDIAFHYDVSNRFYELFLDPLMVYTCAYFRDWSNDLATAQFDKLEMICRKLRLKPGDRLLDIGCGWGALVCHAAEHHGVTALGVTLSEEQIALARERIAARGLSDRVKVELIDYREVTGKFNKISSIGMFEHVAIANHEAYYRKIHQLLEPRGVYLHHAITRKGKASEKAFRAKRPEYDAMTRYIFPGAEVDHIGMTARSLEAYGFEVHDVEAWREHYALTTRHWATRLAANREAAIAEVGEARYRLWLLYLSGVSLAFQRGTLQIFQTVATRRDKGPSCLPPSRADLYR